MAKTTSNKKRTLARKVAAAPARKGKPARSTSSKATTSRPTARKSASKRVVTAKSATGKRTASKPATAQSAKSTAGKSVTGRSVTGKTVSGKSTSRSVVGKLKTGGKPVARKKTPKTPQPVPAGSQATPAVGARRPMQPIQARPIPAAPVTTDGKPRKNQAGLHARELEHFRDLLLAKRRDLVGDMSSMEREALRSSGNSSLSNLPLHMADMGTDNYEQEFTLGLVEKDRNLLREINAALAKIQNGTYGVCEGTGKPIGKVRLEAQPWARHSIEYARQMEKNRMR